MSSEEMRLIKKYTNELNEAINKFDLENEGLLRGKLIFLNLLVGNVKEAKSIHDAGIARGINNSYFNFASALYQWYVDKSIRGTLYLLKIKKKDPFDDFEEVEFHPCWDFSNIQEITNLIETYLDNGIYELEFYDALNSNTEKFRYEKGKIPIKRVLSIKKDLTLKR